jgi:hypothetical protein
MLTVPMEEAEPQGCGPVYLHCKAHMPIGDSVGEIELCSLSRWLAGNQVALLLGLPLDAGHRLQRHSSPWFRLLRTAVRSERATRPVSELSKVAA